MSTVSISPNVVFKRVGEEAVMLDFERGIYYGLDGVGARVWELLAGNASLDDAAAAMAEEYDVELAAVRRDIENLVGELERNGLVTVSD